MRAFLVAIQVGLAIMDFMPLRGPELPSRRVKDDIRRQCSAGEWEPGERLPTVAESAQHYGVAWGGWHTSTKSQKLLGNRIMT